MPSLDILTAARENPVSPYVPARAEWLEGWCGPIIASVDLYGDILHAVQLRTGEMLGLHEIHFRYGGVVMDADVPLSAIRLDLRRREVRHLLVDHGCPAWARDVPAAVWAWASGVEIRELLDPWIPPPWSDGFVHLRSRHGAEPTVNAGAVVDDRCDPGDEPGWCLQPRGGVFRRTALTSGPETGADGRACADLAALRAGCVLEEADGWYVPLVGGGVGWWAR